MKKFVSGMLVGTAITITVLAGVATTIKKAIIDPIKEKEDMIKKDHREAIRKYIAR